jgi:hypothetical protein
MAWIKEIKHAYKSLVIKIEKKREIGGSSLDESLCRL